MPAIRDDGGKLRFFDNQDVERASVSDGGVLLVAGSPISAGAELDYVENDDGTILITSTTYGQNGAQLVIQGNEIVCNGSTRVCVEVFCPAVEPDFHQAIQLNLYEQGTDLGILTTCGTGGPSTNITRSTFIAFGRRFFTPTAGAHTYQIRAWVTGGSAEGNAIYGGVIAGTLLPFVPIYYRVAVA